MSDNENMNEQEGEKKNDSPVLPFDKPEEIEKNINKEVEEPTSSTVINATLSPVQEPFDKNKKQEEDYKRWKENLIRLTTCKRATEINDEDFLINRENYSLTRASEFATGNYSKLYKAKKDSTECVCKVTPLKQINLRYKNHLVNVAVPVMRYLMENQHPSLVLHYAYYQSPQKLYVFMETLSISLDTFMRKNRKANCPNYLKKVKKFSKDIAEGINHLYIIGIAHCNIKTLNVCLTSDLENAKLVGFNNSMEIFDITTSKEILCNKYLEWSNYKAPETLKGNFKAVPADVWSLGIMIVVLLTGKSPFGRKIYKAESRLKSHFHRHFFVPDQTIMGLLLSCFEKDATKRIEIANVLLHPFLNQ